MGGKRICGDVLLVPLGLTGHITPLMYVAKGLMKRGLTMTMVLPENDNGIMKEHLEEEGMEGFHLELVMDPRKLEGGDPGILGMSTNFGRACEPYLNQVRAAQEAGEEGPKCMIADQFMGWSQSWATKLQIPRYVIMCSPATFAYTMYNHSALIAKGILENPDVDPVIDLPGIPLLHLGDLTGAAKRSPKFITSSGDTFGEAAGMLFNTFYDLESSSIDAFDAQVKAMNSGGKGPKMLSIGPMLPPEFFSEETFVGTTKESECTQWLDTRPASSVVYIAFGSSGYLSPPQIKEMAEGLEASKESFLWVLRVRDSCGETVDVSALLPAGFQERTKDQGLIYSKFAPQLQILSHPATGCFLTHCGWNSSLESICRGVPVIGWPMAAEQKLCCRILVDQAKAGIEVRPGLDAKLDLVKSHEVEKAVRLLMKESKGKELKKRALELQLHARVAVAPGGSSFQNFETLVKDIQDRSSRISQRE